MKDHWKHGVSTTVPKRHRALTQRFVNVSLRLLGVLLKYGVFWNGGRSMVYVHTLIEGFAKGSMCVNEDKSGWTIGKHWWNPGVSRDSSFQSSWMLHWSSPTKRTPDTSPPDTVTPERDLTPDWGENSRLLYQRLVCDSTAVMVESLYSFLLCTKFVLPCYFFLCACVCLLVSFQLADSWWWLYCFRQSVSRGSFAVQL